MPKTYSVYVVAGTDATVAENGKDAIVGYEFETKAERDAFVIGVDVGAGWMEASCYTNKKEATAHVRTAIKENGE